MKRIILMGSPEFALPSFKSILESSQFEIVGLFCQPDKRSGRGQKFCAPACKKFAEKNNIPIFQPDSLKGDALFETYKDLNPDLTLVAAYGKIIPKRFLALPKLGCFNIHSSMLPELRGAAPINWAIVRGYKKTGITIFKIVSKLDSGDIYFQQEVDIDPHENAQDLHDKLAKLSGEIIVDFLADIFKNKLKAAAQNNDLATYAPIIKKEDGKIDFLKPGNEIYNLIRGFTPWPGSFTSLDGKTFKIIKAELFQPKAALDKTESGTIYDLKNGFVKLSDSSLKLITVQIEGKKAMDYKDFIRGYKPQSSPPLFK